MRERLVRFGFLGVPVSDDPKVVEQIGRVKGLMVEAKTQKEATDIAARFLEGNVTDIER